MKVGIIGLGIIGTQWAKHLHADGVLAACWNRTTKQDLPVFESRLENLVDKAEMLHLCLADPAAVSSVLKQIMSQLGPRHFVIQSSTIDPISAANFRKLVEARGAQYVEAPFTGSLPAAEKRELIFYLGGEPASIEQSLTYLARLSKKTVVIGNEKQAASLKLVMNLQIACVMQAMAEALSTARDSGITENLFFEAFKLNASYSGVAALKEPKLRFSDFSPQFSTKHMAKDLRLLHQTAASDRKPFLNILQSIYKQAEQSNLSDEDFSSLIKLCEAKD